MKIRIGAQKGKSTAAGELKIRNMASAAAVTLKVCNVQCVPESKILRKPHTN